MCGGEDSCCLGLGEFLKPGADRDDRRRVEVRLWLVNDIDRGRIGWLQPDRCLAERLLDGRPDRLVGSVQIRDCGAVVVCDYLAALQEAPASQSDCGRRPASGARAGHGFPRPGR